MTMRIVGRERAKLGARLAAGYRAGNTIRSLAEETGHSTNFVRRLLHERGVKMRRAADYGRKQDGAHAEGVPGITADTQAPPVLLVSWVPTASRIGPPSALPPGHPLAGLTCPLCPPNLLGNGQQVSVLVIEPANEYERESCDAGERHAAVAYVVHWDCAQGLGPEELESVVADLRSRRDEMRNPLLTNQRRQLSLPPETTILQCIGNELRRNRLIAGMRQSQLATLSRLPEFDSSSVERLEAGREDLSLTSFMIICWTLGADAGAVLQTCQARWQQMEIEMGMPFRGRRLEPATSTSVG